MTAEERQLADAWYQALRDWKTKRLTDALPTGPRRTPKGAAVRVVWGCPVCRSLRAPEFDLAILEARARGEDLRPIVRWIAEELRVREEVVWTHAREHLDPAPARPLVGEWARRRRIDLGEHLLTPAGWIPVERVLAVIRRAPPDIRARLDAIRFRRVRRRSLLDSNGQFRDKESRLLAEAALWLAGALLTYPLNPPPATPASPRGLARGRRRVGDYGGCPPGPAGISGLSSPTSTGAPCSGASSARSAYAAPAPPVS